MNNQLEVEVFNKPQFFSLYCEGPFFLQTFTEDSSVFHFKENAVLFLYYTFSAHRRVYCIRNETSSFMSELPNVNKKTTILFKQFASRVDKTKRAVSYLKEHYENYSFSFDNQFYYKLDILLKEKGKLNYVLLDALCKRSIADGCFVKP